MEKEQKNLVKIAGEFFKQHKDRKEVFISSDGQCFFNKNMASYHIQTRGLRLYTFNPSMLKKAPAKPTKTPRHGKD